jgi:hypothetical protein
LKRIVREKIPMQWHTILFDEEGFARHEEAFLRLGDLASKSGARTLRHGWSGAVRDRPHLYAATFGMSDEVADLYEQMMADVPVEEYDHQDVEKGKA